MGRHLFPDPFRPVRECRNRRRPRIQAQLPRPCGPLRPTFLGRSNSREGHPGRRRRQLPLHPFFRRGRHAPRSLGKHSQPHLTPAGPRVYAGSVRVKLDFPRRSPEAGPARRPLGLPHLGPLPGRVGDPADQVGTDPDPAQLLQAGAGRVEGPTRSAQHHHPADMGCQMVRSEPGPGIPGRLGRAAMAAAVVTPRDTHRARRRDQRFRRVRFERGVFPAVAGAGAQPPFCASGWTLRVSCNNACKNARPPSKTAASVTASPRPNGAFSMAAITSRCSATARSAIRRSSADQFARDVCPASDRRPDMRHPP
jgi:hypothetical protein